MNSVRQSKKRHIRVPSKLADSDYGIVNEKKQKNKQNKNLNVEVMNNDSMKGGYANNGEKMDENLTGFYSDTVEEVRESFDCGNVNKDAGKAGMASNLNVNDITPRVASGDLRDALSVIFGLSVTQDTVMSDSEKIPRSPTRTVSSPFEG
ncbi:hypothetical protein Tco_0584181 [Tanacetum coccineum]